MTSFLKKDVLLLLRDYKELALLVGMPLILIAILGFALGGLLQGDSVALDVSAVLVVEDDQAAGLQAFDTALAESDLPPAVRAQLALRSRAIRPVETLRGLLTSEDLAEFVNVRELPRAEAMAELESDDAAAVIVIPEGYSRDLLGGMFLGETPGAELQLNLSDAAPLGSSVIRDVIDGFAAELNFQTALGQLGYPPMGAPTSTASGGIEHVGSERQVSSFAYFAIGMAVMFMLYIVGSTASRAFLELSNNSFDRIVISDASSLAYLLSKVGSSAAVVVLQVAFLLVAATLLFGALGGQPASFWLAAALVVALMALAVGALAALMTAVNFRVGNKTASEAFNAVVVFLFAMLGGSFFPIEETAPALANLGLWTPNGAGLDTLLGLAQGASLGAFGPNLVRLGLVTVVLLIAAIFIFPRRRVA